MAQPRVAALAELMVSKMVFAMEAVLVEEQMVNGMDYLWALRSALEMEIQSDHLRELLKE